MDNLTKVTDATGKESGFTYDLEGNMLSFTDARGKIVKMAAAKMQQPFLFML